MLIAWGCGTQSLRPVEIDAADMCSFCRMAVSQVRYAAEIVAPDDAVFKFDDIGCMLRFLKEHRPPNAVIFVHDYAGAGWIRAADARYVRAETIPSPMGGHIIALQQDAAAAEHAQKFRGAKVRWEEL